MRLVQTISGRAYECMMYTCHIIIIMIRFITFMINYHYYNCHHYYHYYYYFTVTSDNCERFKSRRLGPAASAVIGIFWAERSCG